MEKVVENITPKEKAKELLVQMDQQIGTFANDLTRGIAYKCVLVMVDEILSLKMIGAMGRNEKFSEGEFWEQVRLEVENMEYPLPGYGRSIRD